MSFGVQEPMLPGAELDIRLYTSILLITLYTFIRAQQEERPYNIAQQSLTRGGQFGHGQKITQAEEKY